MSRCRASMRVAAASLLLLAIVAAPHAAAAAEPIAVFVVGAEERLGPAGEKITARFAADGRFRLRPWSEVSDVMRAPSEATEMASERRSKLMQEARERIAAADALLEAFDLKKVMPELDSALRKMRLAVRAEQLDDLVALHVKRASLNISLGSNAGVRAELEHILALKPAFELDAELARPSVVRALQQAREASASRTVLSAMVLSEPSGATVSVDGKRVGEAPVALRKLPAGHHLLEVTLPGHLAWAKMVELDVNRTDPFRIELVYLPGSRLLQLKETLASFDDLERAAALIDGAAADADVGMLLFVERSKAERYRLRLYDSRQRAFSSLQTAPNGSAGLEIAVDALLRELGPSGLTASAPATVVERVIERPAVEEAEPWYKRWWVWAGGTVLLVGGGVAAAVLIEREGKPPPGYDLNGSIE